MLANVESKIFAMTQQTLEQSATFPKQIQAMFGAIAPQYDFLNGLLSFGRDRYWRKAAVDLLAPRPGERILDVATGTADVALEIACRDLDDIRVIGVDFSFKMLQLARRKIRGKRLDRFISLQAGDGENLPFPDNRFHGVTSAFGIRNFNDIEKGLSEKWRVLKPGGKVVIAEFSLPKSFIFRFVYLFYFGLALPLIGRLISGHSVAYSYLPESVAEFPRQAEFARIMEKCGFKDVAYRDLTCGITTIYTGCKDA
ncbi:MAG: bifunctional demethylmenaquinone methyltransferase/2-methoxy-6-polyprenyl-1,4-benzoquinol methylase UbiE [Nitrospinales bacterium]